MKNFKVAIAVFFVFGVFFPLIGSAEDAPVSTDTSSAALVEKRLQSLEQEITVLKEQLQVMKQEEAKKAAETPNLQQEIAVLKRQLEVKTEEDAKKAADTPIITANIKDGFSIKSADESFKLKIRGYTQTDGRFFFYDKKDLGVNDTFSVRRARLIFEGSVGKNFDFYIMPDFGSGASTLVDAYSEIKFSPSLKFKAGKFKVPFGLERLQSDSANNFTETGLPSNLVPNREIGLQLSGDLLKESINYNFGIFNGSADLASSNGQDTDNNDDKDVIGRVFVFPFKNNGPELVKGFGVGLAGSYGHNEGATLPTYKSAGQASIFSYSSGVTADGLHSRITPQAYFYKGSLGLLTEYVQSHQKVVRTSGANIIRETFENTGWQISGNYVLTGELATYKGVTPRNNFDFAKKTWGALDIVARYEHLSIDNSIFNSGFASLATKVSGADAWGLGINWYLSKNYRVSLGFEQTQFDRGASVGDRRTEDVVLTRFQVSY